MVFAFPSLEAADHRQRIAVARQVDRQITAVGEAFDCAGLDAAVACTMSGNDCFQTNEKRRRAAASGAGDTNQSSTKLQPERPTGCLTLLCTLYGRGDGSLSCTTYRLLVYTSDTGPRPKSHEGQGTRQMDS